MIYPLHVEVLLQQIPVRHPSAETMDGFSDLGWNEGMPEPLIVQTLTENPTIMLTKQSAWVNHPRQIDADYRQLFCASQSGLWPK